MEKHVEVWGCASGHGTTEHAARGAFTVRDYPNRESIPQEDWLSIRYVVTKDGKCHDE